MMRNYGLAALLGTLLATVLAAPALADVKISDRAYVRSDGGLDATIVACSSDATTTTPSGDGSGNRQQNEPTAAVDPNNALHMSAGANDYCPSDTSGDVWAGFYYSSDGGASWTNSLLPGYPADTSADGQASPLHGLVGAAGDPVQAWDNTGHLYYAGIAFNRAKPATGSIWIARYGWPLVATTPDYEFTTLVSRGTPSPIFLGHFEDKVQLEVDKGAASPNSGSIYLCWTRYTGNGPNNFVEFARSTDGGQTFTIKKISEGVHGSQFCDIAVTKNGTVFVAWRQFEFNPEIGQRQNDAVAWVKSTNGGQSFTKPSIATEFTHFDPGDHFVSPEAAGRAKFEACLVGDSTLGSCRSPEPRQTAGDCGDGPLACQSGYVFHRGGTQVRITADPTAAGNPNAAYVVYDASVPGTETPTGSTYGTIVSGTGSQASIILIRTLDGGASWSSPTRIDPQAKGHQYFPDIDANAGKLYAVWQDSRVDTPTGPPGTAADFRTVPVNNDWVSANPPGAVRSSPDGLQSFYATKSLTASGELTAGAWTTALVSTVNTMPQYEQFGARDVPFFGDYNYIDAAGSVLMNWTDQRDAVAGGDPRYTNGDGTDGFDVLQCRVFSMGAWSGDNCHNAGGLNQNIYGFVTTG
jgi:hypothetical protein